MSVSKDDLKKAFQKINPSGNRPDKGANIADKEDLKKAFQSVKKKESPTLLDEPSDTPPASVVPSGSTTNTPPPVNWDDNPLNPVKAANDFEEKRDKTPETLFKETDKQQLVGLASKYAADVNPTKVVPANNSINPAFSQFKSVPKTENEINYETSVKVESDIKGKIQELNKQVAQQKYRGSNSPESKAIDALNADLVEAKKLQTKAATELVVNGDKQIEINRRTDSTGNSFKAFIQDAFGGKPGGWETQKRIEDKLTAMPTQFITGLNMLKLTEPAEFGRVTDAISNGLPVSASQAAQITSLGLNIEEAKLKRDILKSPVSKQEREAFNQIGTTLAELKPEIEKYQQRINAKQPLSPAQAEDYKAKIDQYNTTLTQSKPLIDKVNSIDGEFAKKAQALQETRKSNLIDNPEVLRSFISDGVANKLDEIGKDAQEKDGTDPQKVGINFMLGHTWNYSPEEIKWASEQYLTEQGIDPNSPQVQQAIKYLQDNEGVMLGENSIAKAAGFRELGEGLIQPIVGMSKSIDDWTARTLNDTYAESKSEGNVNVAKKRLAIEDTGVRGVVNDVIQGAGQYVTQAVVMYATSGLIGTIGEGILGKSGVELLAKVEAAGIKPSFAFDDATAHLATGNFLNKIKNPLAVFTTSYAMAYDSNLKSALSYTSDNALAKRAASFNASMEGATELFLSPLEIAEGIVRKFSKNETKDLLKIFTDKSLKDSKGALNEYVGRFVKGVLGTSKVATAEIGEELVTQISDYVTNMYLNPNSDSFKNRSLQSELMQTAYQTGLTMAVPALMNGVGAAQANTFSKGALLVAAQNRLKIVDGLNNDLAANKIDQQTYNTKVQILNTAAEANTQLPKTKQSGKELTTNNKADYVWSRVTEAVLDSKMKGTNDEAQKIILREQIKKQQDYRAKMLGVDSENDAAAEPTNTTEIKPDNNEKDSKKSSSEEADAQKANAEEEGNGQGQRQDVAPGDTGDNKDTPVSLTKNEQAATDAIQGIDYDTEEGRKVKFWTDLLQNPETTDADKKQALKELSEQLGDKQTEATTGIALGKAADAIYDLVDENKKADAGLKLPTDIPDGQPLSKIDQFAAKKRLETTEVPGNTVDEKLFHISQQKDAETKFGKSLADIAAKRFPAEKETKKAEPAVEHTQKEGGVAIPAGEGNLDNSKNVNLQNKNNNDELTEQLPNTLSPTEKQGSIAGGEKNAAATAITGAIHRAVEETGKGSKKLPPDQVRQKEESELKKYAEDNGILIKNDFGEPDHFGNEQDVYVDSDGKTVTKINDNPTHDTWNDFFHKIAIHNSLFPDVAYTLKGFSERDGHFAAVLEQPLITKGEEPVKFSEVTDELGKMGFEPSTDPKDFSSSEDYKNKKSSNVFFNQKTGVKISDLHGENVIKGTDGKIHFIDPIITIDKTRIVSNIEPQPNQSKVEPKAEGVVAIPVGEVEVPKLTTVKVDLKGLTINELNNVAKQLRQKAINARDAEKQGKSVIGGSQSVENDYQAVKKYISELAKQPQKEVDVPIPALQSVESTAKALEGLNTAELEAPLLAQIAGNRIIGKSAKQTISEAYHADKKTGKKTELTKAVESLLANQSQKEGVEAVPALRKGVKKADRQLQGVRLQASQIEDLTAPGDIVLQYFASGGKINSEAIKSIYGNSASEMRARISLMDKNGPTITELQHELWQSDESGLYEDDAFRDAIDDVLQRYTSPSQFAQALVDKYIVEPIRGNLTQEESELLDNKFLANVSEVAENLTGAEKTEIENLLKKYQGEEGEIDWVKLEEDTQGFSPDILNLSSTTQNKLDEIINNKNQDQGQAELDNLSGESSSSENEEENQKLAEQKQAEKIAALEEEKRNRINEVTKPNLSNIPDLIISDMMTLATTTEANRQQHQDIKEQLYSLKNLIDCLF